jgi:hypothetical protein
MISQSVRVGAGARNNYALHLAIGLRDHQMVDMLLGIANVVPDVGDSDPYFSSPVW